MSDKKPMWHYSEIPVDDEITALMPGFEIQYVVTDQNCDDDRYTVFGHCVFPPHSAHYAHRHTEAEELIYVIRGRVVNGQVDEDGVVTEYEAGPGTSTFIARGRIHWTRNPYAEEAEFVFGNLGASSLEKGGYVDLTNEVPVKNEPITGTVTWPEKIERDLARPA